MNETDSSRGSVEVPERPRVRPDVVFRELADEWVVFDGRGRRLHVMNLTAALVWTHCDGRRTEEEIVDAVRDAYSDPPSEERVAGDVREALESFVRGGLLVEAAEHGERGGP